jgi:sensor histidine kinase YesM
MGWQAYQLMLTWKRVTPSFAAETANQLIDCYAWALMGMVIWQFMRFFSLQGAKWKRDLAAHIVLSVLMAPVATLLYISGIALTRLGTDSMTVMERMRLNLRGELIQNALEYLTFLAILVSVENYRRYRDQEQEKVQLQHALTESKLHTLRAQLNPHFLFNAMNSVSCLLHRDAAAADTMLSRVANLLRLSLARDDSGEVRLLEEIELAEEYLEIQKIRFGSRLKLDIDIADEVLEARVPNMLLQPLVENACVHGVARTRGDCRLGIQARLEGEQLLIVIYNDGPPVRRDWKSQSGIGLRNTLERLSLLYGESAKLELSNVQGGVRLRVRIPMRDVSDQIEAYGSLPTITPVQPNAM